MDSIHLNIEKTKDSLDNQLKKLRLLYIEQLKLRKFPITIPLQGIEKCIYKQIAKELKNMGYIISYKIITTNEGSSENKLVFVHTYTKIMVIENK